MTTMQIGVRNETHGQSGHLLHLCFSERCLHTARHQERVTGALNALHEQKDTMHYRHGRKELPAA